MKWENEEKWDRDVERKKKSERKADNKLTYMHKYTLRERDGERVSI